MFNSKVEPKIRQSLRTLYPKKLNGVAYVITQSFFLTKIKDISLEKAKRLRRKQCKALLKMVTTTSPIKTKLNITIKYKRANYTSCIDLVTYVTIYPLRISLFFFGKTASF